jgi:predicted nucleic acid-binding protein
MVYPTVHLNGTSREELLQQVEFAGQALCNAYDALAKMAPHARDYYPQGPDAILAATKEHSDRLHRLATINSEIERIYEALQEDNS